MARHSWLNTMVGYLDTAFSLTEEELFFTQDILRRLLAALDIPGRSPATELPAAVALEVENSTYSMQIHGIRHAGVIRMVRAVRTGDIIVTLEAWRQALVTLLTSSYDLAPFEVLTATRVLDDLLLALGVPQRAANYMPEDVVRAHLEGA